MHLIEAFIALLAPHICLVCRKEGNVLCPSHKLKSAEAVCYKCTKPSLVNPCVNCAQQTSIKRLHITTNYEFPAKDLVASLKFERAKASAKVIASFMRGPPLVSDLIVCPVPTANRRARMRGYDQAKLIAKNFARKNKLNYSHLLVRVGSTRQVGANREQRFEQLKNAYIVKKSVQNSNILLIDDVLTTGSTLESAANTLIKAGASSVSASVFAYSKPKNSSSTRSD